MKPQELYFSVAEAERSVRRIGNLRFYVEYLFNGVEFAGARVLDVGAGAGWYSFYAAAAGAAHVVALEPGTAGSTQGGTSLFENLRERLGPESVELRHETLQEFNPGDERFDVVLMHASINHLDEPATMALPHDAGARQSYTELFVKLAAMSSDGAKLVVTDVSSHNVFAKLPVPNPLAPTIEWNKHQPPETWIGLLSEAGFIEPRVRWSTPNSLRGVGRVLLGNRAGAWLTQGAFCLTMTVAPRHGPRGLLRSSAALIQRAYGGGLPVSMRRAAQRVEVERHTCVASLSSEWDELAERTNSSPWSRPGWIDAWWKAFGHGSLEIYALRRNGALAGVLPLVVRHGAISTPTNAHTPGFAPVVQDDEAREQLVDIVFSRTRGSLELLFLSVDDPILSACGAAARRRGYRTRRQPMLRSPFVPIVGDWASFEAGLRPRFRSELRRRGRRLAELGAVELAFESGSQDLDALLAEAFRLEASAWKGAKGTAIISRPETERFYRDVALWGAERGLLRLAFLRLDGRPLAFEFCLRQGGVHYNLKGGYDAEFHRLGPSRLLHHQLLERAFTDGLSSYEFLGNADAWKLDWTAEVHESTAFQAFSNTPAGLARAAVIANVDRARRVRNWLRRNRSRLSRGPGT
jgi:CelD/BcsL family acetyltransferase involved in cellulose biosynthesis/SAM-dependent methyltransferase